MFHLPLDLSHIARCTLHRGLLLPTLHVFQIAQSHLTLQLICANCSLTQVRLAPHILKKMRTSRLTFRMSHVTLQLHVAHHTSHLSQEDLTSNSAHTCADDWQVMNFFRRRQQFQKTTGRTRARKHWIDALDEHLVHSLRFCNCLCSDRPSFYIRANAR